jgi:hypothetical protein
MPHSQYCAVKVGHLGWSFGVHFSALHRFLRLDLAAVEWTFGNSENRFKGPVLSRILTRPERPDLTTAPRIAPRARGERGGRLGHRTSPGSWADCRSQ